MSALEVVLREPPRQPTRDDFAALLKTELSGLENPYLDAVVELGYPWHPRTAIYDGEEAFRRELRAVYARYHFVTWYAWAIPDERALEIVGRGGEVVEVGAGGGYWASLLRARGVTVHAYDRHPGGNAQVERLWGPVNCGYACDAARHPDATLFLCWPPYESRLAQAALERYRRAGGRRLVYIGEHYGCTANDAFHDTLEQLPCVERHVLPHWPGMHDYVAVYEW